MIIGVSYSEFTMDKQVEFAWNKIVSYYFSHLGIALFKKINYNCSV